MENVYRMGFTLVMVVIAAQTDGGPDSFGMMVCVPLMTVKVPPTTVKVPSRQVKVAARGVKVPTNDG
jgi:hypothetical protein